MIASLLHLERSDIQLLKLKREYDVHKLIYSLFPGVKRTFLYYDQGGDLRGKNLLLLSKSQPLLPTAGNLQSKHVPEDYLSYPKYAFQVLLNPVIRRGGNSRFIPVTGQEDLASWFIRRAPEWGFCVDVSSLEVTDTGVTQIQKAATTLMYNKALFTGIIEIQDSVLFKESFEFGIGRGKAFGFGLLQIKPLLK
jgi:CRISPR system Cascade subunit CasE